MVYKNNKKVYVVFPKNEEDLKQFKKELEPLENKLDILYLEPREDRELDDSYIASYQGKFKLHGEEDMRVFKHINRD